MREKIRIRKARKGEDEKINNIRQRKYPKKA
jgi:hypothetical protein